MKITLTALVTFSLTLIGIYMMLPGKYVPMEQYIRDQNTINTKIDKMEFKIDQIHEFVMKQKGKEEAREQWNVGRSK